MNTQPQPAKVMGELHGLTEREVQVLSLIGEGLSTEAIAQRLNRRVETVRSHRRSLGKKLGISNRVELARFAIRVGLCSVRQQTEQTDIANISDRLWLISSAMDATRVPMIVADCAGHPRFVNNAAAERLEGIWSKAEPLQRLWPAAGARVLAMLQAGESGSVEIRLPLLPETQLSPDAPPMPAFSTFEVQFAPLRDESQRVAGSIITLIDVSQRAQATAAALAERDAALRQLHGLSEQQASAAEASPLRRRAENDRAVAEERTRALARVTPAGVFITNASGDITFVNHRLRVMVGCLDPAPHTNSLFDHLDPRDRTQTMQAWERALHAGLPFELRLRFAPGEGRVPSAILRAEPVMGPDGAHTGFVGSLVEVARASVPSIGAELKDLIARPLVKSAV